MLTLTDVGVYFNVSGVFQREPLKWVLTVVLTLTLTDVGIGWIYHNHTDILSHFSGVGVDVVFPRQRYMGLAQPCFSRLTLHFPERVGTTRCGECQVAERNVVLKTTRLRVDLMVLTLSFRVSGIRGQCSIKTTRRNMRVDLAVDVVFRVSGSSFRWQGLQIVGVSPWHCL